MKPLVQSAINDQIQAELQSAYVYLSMSAQFEELNFKGAAKWMRSQWQEEIAHGLKLFDFLLRRGGSPVLQQLDAPAVSFKTVQEAFEQALENEQRVTGLIHSLYELAVAEKDYSLQTLLHWFIDEQVEEEEAVEEIIQSLKLAGDTGEGLLLIDRELGQRQSETKEE